MQDRVHIHSTSRKCGAKFGRGRGTTTKVGAGEHERSSLRLSGHGVSDERTVLRRTGLDTDYPG
ncbi:hypothetical protein Rhow_006613 [Rhodococcus wratislaviensis]|jgi:hypothetical protein|uniref:Uncharacterized protein n=1 Tax=Rhodococcus wratislaviensis TaxID=44752 RepID=A0A402C0R3_RHOWR|nr:hypothetical protein Rhow_006613 [Rhodococcus wratislaviensis]